MDKSYTIEQLRKVKGIGDKTIQRIVESYDDSVYVSQYDQSVHIEPDSLVQGDMLEVMNGIPDKSVDMILTDLPYGAGATDCEWDNRIDFDKMWKQYNRVIKDDGAIVLFGSEPFSSELRMSNFDNYRYDWIWEKERGTGFALSRKMPMRKHENISVFYKSLPYYDSVGSKKKVPQKRSLPTTKSKSDSVSSNNLDENGNRIYVVRTHNTKHTMLKFTREVTQRIHPTQKPVKLLEHLISTYTKEGEVVLDSTMGVGSTCLGAKNLNRRYIGIELDPEYYKIAKQRIEG